MKLGVDVDGVLADFNGNFIERYITVIGEDKFPARPFEIKSWNYPEDDYGYSVEQTGNVWSSIKRDRSFWQDLPPYEDTHDAMRQLSRLSWEEHDIYFITSRMGVKAKQQTEDWIMNNGFSDYPTVLISSEKGLCARALKLDFYIDDRTENCEDVRDHAMANCVMLARSWNRDIPNVPRIPNMAAFFDAVNAERGGGAGWVN